MPSNLLATILLVGLTSLLLAVAVTPLVRRLAVAVGCVSRPAQDRWGRRVVPRLGGIPIAWGFLAAAGWASWQEPRMLGVLLAGLWIFGVGLIDDFKRLHPNTKLIAQILAGCMILLAGNQFNVQPTWLAIPLTIGWLVLVMNAFNLMDNMDGLSAGIGAIAAGFCAVEAFTLDQFTTAVIAAALAGSTLGFLRYNLPPAKIFMGDTGSQVLGLGLGTLVLMESWKQPAQLLVLLALPTLLLAVPLFDTLFVTLQRILHGRHPFQGGRDHTSHRLGVLGLSPRQVVFTLYTLSASFGGLSIILPRRQPLTVAGIWLVAIGLLATLGAYLAKVRVYTVLSNPPTGARVTLIETMLMHKRRILEVSVDFVFICACYVMAYALRFEGHLTPDIEALIFQSLPWVITVKMISFFAFGLYRGVWRYISLPDLTNILKAVLTGSILSALTVLYLWRFEGYSRAVFIIDGILLFLAISGARLVEPMLNEWIHAAIARPTPVAILGAGDTGELLLQQLKLDRAGARRVVGFLDDDLRKRGDRIHGVPILGTRNDLGRVVQAYGIQEILIAIRRPPEPLVRQVQGYCEENGLLWRVASSTLSSEEVPQRGASSPGLAEPIPPRES